MQMWSPVAVVGAAALGVTVGWAAGRPRVLGVAFLYLFVSLLLVPVSVLVLISAQCALITLAGVLVGWLLRILVDALLAQVQPKGGIYG